MYRFWEVLVAPICEEIKAKTIIEVGAQDGFQTKKLIDYAVKNSGYVISIDPFPNFEWHEWEKKYCPHFKMYVDLSLNILPKLNDYDIILLDGDHNWFTVFNELRVINETCSTRLPVIVLHDVGWPYDRRDLYYNPQNIPDEYRNPYEKKAISPNQASLTDSGINGHLCNAIEYGTCRNGVLTAIDDFLQENPHLSFLKIECISGLGIIYDPQIHKSLRDLIMNPNMLLSLLKTGETARIDEFYKRMCQCKEYQSTIEKYKERSKQLEQALNVSVNNEQIQRSKLVDEENKNTELENEIKDINNELITECKKGEKMAQLQAELQKANTTNANLVLTINNCNTEIKALKVKIKELDKTIKDAQNNALKLNQKLQDTKKKAASDNRTNKKEIIKYREMYKSAIGNVRYHIGTIFVEALQSPKKFLLAPARLIHLAYRYHKIRKDYFLTQKVSPTQITSSAQGAPCPSSENNEPINYSRNNETTVSVSDINMEQNWRSYPYQLIETQLKQKISIIVPIYNAPDDLTECIKSILQNTAGNYELLLIDDCSPDPKINNILSAYQSDIHIKILKNQSNMGYVKTINYGISSSTGDMIFLNSDTKVTRNWLTNLITAAYSDPDVMTVTPFSNAAGAFSVPEVGKNEGLPANVSLQNMAQIVKQCSQHDYVSVPTGNGFCMYVKREAIKLVGKLDDEAFSRGYGEENDFCMRLVRQGYKNIIADDTYIYHKRSASFGTEKNELIRKNRAILDARYPEYKAAISIFNNNESLIQNRSKIEECLSCTNKPGRSRILYVLHEGGGGTVKTNEDLMIQVQKNNYDCFMLTSDMFNIFLYRVTVDKLEKLKSWKLSKKWNIQNMYDLECQNIYFDVLKNLEIDIVHVRHLFKHSLDIIKISRLLDIPVIMSFHDFYYICPTINLINSDGVYCEGKCRKNDGKCMLSTQHIKINGSISRWVNDVWRPEMHQLYESVSAFVTTSEYTKKIYLMHYPEIENRFHIIEHGRDFSYERRYRGQAPQNKVKILIAGNINYAKGEKYILELIHADVNHKLEFHVMGNMVPSLEPYVIYHGTYKRDEFCNEVEKIKPAYIGIFSIWPETYCHVLTESWSCGLPAIISDIGTLRERGLKNGGCILADLTNPSKTCQNIIETSFNTSKYNKLCKEALRASYRTVKEMSADYIKLYNQTLCNKI